jgi:sortase A
MRQMVRLVGLAMVTAGSLILAGWAASLLAGEWSQAAAEQSWERTVGVVAGRPAQVPPPPALARPVNRVDFGLLVPRLGYRAPVREGVSDDVLFAGPGHYPGSGWPGQPATVAVAAHNVYWLRFDQLRSGDEVALQTRYGTFRYHVTGTAVVGPDDLSVLAQVPGRRLTLTTCWPLWAGQLATSRLAIFAA